MSGTLASASAVTLFSIIVGQAVLVACGWRQLSWLAPPVGLALLCTVAGLAIRAPGHATTTVAVLAALVGASVLLLAVRRPDGINRAAWVGLPVAVAALGIALIPFLARGRFGVLGTGFNPDMQQHLLIADWLQHRAGPEPSYVRGGYPLGPHAVVVAISKAFGVGLVQSFDGLTAAVAPLTALTALGALRALTGGRRMVVALLTAFAYLAAAYLAEGAFKETIMALFVLGLAVGLWDLVDPPAGAPATLHQRALPLLALAPGAVYVYSFPGLALLGAVAVLWAMLDPASRHTLQQRRRQAGMAVLAAALVAAPLLAIEWHSVTRFFGARALNPEGRGLGNLFHSLTPFPAFGIWPTGDYRLNPGEGHIPAVVYYAAAALGIAALAFGLARWWRAGDRALPAALALTAATYVGTTIGASPYTAAKALAVAAPLVMVIAAGGLLLEPGDGEEEGRPAALGLNGLIALALIVGAGGSSFLALSRAQVGPTAYTPAVYALRSAVQGQTVLALVPPQLAAQRGGEFVTWDLRGSTRTARTAGPPSRRPPPAGYRFVVSSGSVPPFSRLRLVKARGDWRLWERR